MEPLIKLAAENIVILGFVVSLTFSLFIYIWRRRSSQASEVKTLDYFEFEETQSKTKKPGKVRPRKTKPEKVTSVQHVPNGTLNKSPVKSVASVEKTALNVAAGGPAKSEGTKRSKESVKKQPKSSEVLGDLSGDWTVAISKKKPKTKKEPSPSKDHDGSDHIVKSAELKLAAVETNIEVVTVADQAKVQPELPASANDGALEKDGVNMSVLPAVEHVAPVVVETTTELEVSETTSMEEVQDGIAVAVAKNKKKKNKKNKSSSDAAPNAGCELETSDATRVGKGDNGTVTNAVKTVTPGAVTKTVESLKTGAVTNTVKTVTPGGVTKTVGSVATGADTNPVKNEAHNSDTCTLSDKRGVSPPESSPSPEVDESVPVKSTNSSLSSSFQSGIVFDELGDEAPVAAAAGKKNKKKPRREN